MSKTKHHFIRESRDIALLCMILVVIFFSGCNNNQRVYVEEGRKRVNGTELYYKIMGDGEPIVVLHGGPGFEHTYLLPQMGKLADTYKLIFYDQRASGGSKADADSSSITLDAFVEDLEGIRKTFDLDKMNLMGHSWGGMLAMFYTIKYPQNVNSLMLINSGGARSDFWSDLYANIDRDRTSEDSLALAKLRASKDFKNKSVAAWEKFYNIFFRPYFHDQDYSDSLNMKFSETTVSNMPVISSSPLNRAVRNYDIVDQLSAIYSPTLIIHGEDDVIPHKYAQEIHWHIPDSRLVVLKQCGHFSYIEKPDTVFDLVYDFMDQMVRD